MGFSFLVHDFAVAFWAVSYHSYQAPQYYNSLWYNNNTQPISK